jgi:hypothetical protein
MERGVWDLAIVCFDVESNKSSHALPAVQGIQEQPLMLQCPPPGFDQSDVVKS